MPAIDIYHRGRNVKTIRSDVDVHDDKAVGTFLRARAEQLGVRPEELELRFQRGGEQTKFCV